MSDASELEKEVELLRERVADLQGARDYLENLVNYSNAPIVVWDPDLRITRFNRAFERLTGYAADDVIGRGRGRAPGRRRRPASVGWSQKRSGR